MPGTQPRSASKSSPSAVKRAVDLMRRHRLLAYYVSVIAISWGGGLIVLGTDVFIGLKPMTKEQMIPTLVCVWLATTVAGLGSVALVGGKSGLLDLRARWTRWRVGWRWYAFALLTAPVLSTGILATLGLVTGSRAFQPLVVTATDKVGVLLPAIAVGLLNSFFEEMGWTGFAVPQFLKRHGVVTTGLIVGLLWGAWHFPMFAGDANVGAPIAPAAYLALLLFGWLPPYRILMVWAYERTQSALIAWLMHVAIDINVLAILPAANKDVTVVFTLLYGAGLWIIASGVTTVGRSNPRRRVSLAAAS